MASSPGINRDALQRLKESSTPSQVEGEVTKSFHHYLFLSFDIVNSTKIKHQLFNEWSTIFYDFFNETISASRTEIAEKLQPGELKPWKVLGDEIVFKFRLSNLEQIPRLVEVAEALLKRSSENIKGYVLELVKSRHSYSTPYTIPDVKATIWHAKVNEGRPEDIGDSSVCQLIEIPYAPTNYEFIGPDIDIGFRISKAAEKRSIVVDLKVAYVLMLYSEHFESQGIPDLSTSLKLKSYEDLKGVWDEKKYPIILYTLDETSGQQEAPCGIGDELKRYLKELELKDSLYKLMKELKDLGNTEGKDSHKKKLSHEIYNPEIHCVAICFSPDLTSVYIRTRKDGRKDCGCATLDRNQSLEDALLDSYEKDYSMDIRVIGDTVDDINLPIPVASYAIKKDDSLVNGFIFAAIVDNEPKQIKGNVSLEAIDSLVEESGFVPLLKENIEKAKKLISLRQK